ADALDLPWVPAVIGAGDAAMSADQPAAEPGVQPVPPEAPEFSRPCGDRGRGGCEPTSAWFQRRYRSSDSSGPAVTGAGEGASRRQPGSSGGTGAPTPPPLRRPGPGRVRADVSLVPAEVPELRLLRPCGHRGQEAAMSTYRSGRG